MCINMQTYISAKQIQRKRMFGEVYCVKEERKQRIRNKNTKKIREMARDEGNRREESMCLTRVTATCAA